MNYYYYKKWYNEVEKVISMVSEQFKTNIDKATDFIISCWDENNPEDNKTFDDRIKAGLDGLDEEVGRIVENTLNW